MKKIILTASSDLYSDQRMQRISKALHDFGYDVVLVGRYLGRSFEGPYKTVQLKCIFNRGILFYFELNLRVLLFLLTHKYDCLCSVDLDTMLSGWLSSRIKNVRWVFDAHEYYEEAPEVIHRAFIKKFWSKIGLWTVPKTDGAYTVSKSLQELFKTKYSIDFELIRNVPNYHDKADYNVNSKVFLYQGVLNKGRGLEALILCMEELKEYTLLFAGTGDVEEKLKDLVQKKGLNNRVQFLGLISPIKLIELTKTAVLGFNLLEGNSPNYYYSLANKHFDYMMACVPSVSMAFPEYITLNEKYGMSILIDKLEPNELVKHLKVFLNDKELLQKLSTNSRLASKDLNWEMESQKLIKIYQNLLSQ